MAAAKRQLEIAVQVLHEKLDEYLCDFVPYESHKIKSDTSVSDLKEKLLEQLKLIHTQKQKPII